MKESKLAHDTKSARQKGKNVYEKLSLLCFFFSFLVANADALLREKGLLSETSKDSKPLTEELVELTIEQQLKRAQAIEEINAPSFVQQDFKSTKVWGKMKHEVSILIC